MKKIRLTAFILAIVLAFSCIMPVMSFAGQEEAITEEAYTVVPYLLRTEGVEGSSNKVKVWLELSPVIAEAVAAYQITLMLVGREGNAVAGRKMDISFDEALKDAKIKESVFDQETQAMKIYVAATENLVKTSVDESGVMTNILPIGTVTVEAASLKADNPFKIILSGYTGDLKTVGLDCEISEASAVYGTAEAPFEIPVDGTIFAIPDYAYTVSKTGEGTVKAYKVAADGTETALAQGEDTAENTKVRLDVKAADGYSVASVKVFDKATGDEIALGADYSFILSADADVKVVFSKNIVSYTFSVKTSGSGSAKAYKLEDGRETLITDGKLESGTKVRIAAAPDEGFKVSKISVVNKSAGTTIEISGDGTLVISGDTEVIVTFEKVEEEKPTDPPATSDNCTCSCHKGGFFYKILRFLWKLFKMKPVCACGEAHY